jgi:hypothetical protein
MIKNRKIEKNSFPSGFLSVLERNGSQAHLRPKRSRFTAGGPRARSLQSLSWLTAPLPSRSCHSVAVAGHASRNQAEPLASPDLASASVWFGFAVRRGAARRDGLDWRPTSLCGSRVAAVGLSLQFMRIALSNTYGYVLIFLAYIMPLPYSLLFLFAGVV